MKVLIFGSGGREHALAWAVKKSGRVSEVVCAPGNGGMGAAIWGTVVLAATCPACAVGTGIVAFVLFGFAGAIAFTDDQPDRLLYLAPGQQLSRKLGYIDER